MFSPAILEANLLVFAYAWVEFVEPEATLFSPAIPGANLFCQGVGGAGRAGGHGVHPARPDPLHPVPLLHPGVESPGGGPPLHRRRHDRRRRSVSQSVSQSISLCKPVEKWIVGSI